MATKTEKWAFVGKLLTAIIVPGGLFLGGRWAYGYYQEYKISKANAENRGGEAPATNPNQVGEKIILTRETGEPISGYALPAEREKATFPLKVIIKPNSVFFGVMKEGEIIDFEKAEDERKVVFKGVFNGQKQEWVALWRDVAEGTLAV